MTRSPQKTLLSVPLSQLVVIDVQDRLLPVIRDHQAIAASIRFLMDAAAILKVSAVVTEQYPKGLGRTVELLRDHPATITTREKLKFSAAEILTRDPSPSIVSGKEHSGSHAFGFTMLPTVPEAVSAVEHPRAMKKQLVLAGIETHICVQQSALELLETGYQVFVAADCVGSRHTDDHRWALDRMASAGVIISTAEAIAFEWCERAGHDSFKALSRLVRDRDMPRSNSPAKFP
jgi:nicotinamidase-related amidase